MTRKRRSAKAHRPTLGPIVCRWIETFLVHGEGDFLGLPFKLERWQRRIIYKLYEYSFDAKTGVFERLVQRVLIILPKGQGKTELAAAIGLAELAGPVMLDKDGKPCRRVSPNIPVVAASYEQADKLYGAARLMVENGPLAEYIDVFDTEMQLKDDVGKMFRVAAVAGTNDGGLPTTGLFDEVHEMTGNKARVHLVITNSLAKRGNTLEVNISTPDDADPTSLLGRLVDHGEKILAGEVVDPTFLYVKYSAPETIEDKTAEGGRRPLNLDDPDELRWAIRQCHPGSWTNVERVAGRWEISKIPEHEFRRYHLAQFVRGEGSFLPAGSWEARSKARKGHASPPPPEGTAITLGFDGSYNRDSTALVGCTIPTKPRERPYLFVVDVWERPDDWRGEEWVVPRADVDGAVHRAFATWDVEQMGCDPSKWHEEIAAWADVYGETVAHIPRGNVYAADCCAKLYSAVVNNLVDQDGHPAFTRHMKNAVRKPFGAKGGYFVTKTTPWSPRKIDLVIGAYIAYDLATIADVPVEPWALAR